MNVWIAEVSMKRKHCPHCEDVIEGKNSIVSFGEYISGKYHKWGNACAHCINEQVASMIKRDLDWQYKVRSGCSVRWHKG